MYTLSPEIQPAYKTEPWTLNVRPINPLMPRTLHRFTTISDHSFYELIQVSIHPEQGYWNVGIPSTLLEPGKARHRKHLSLLLLVLLLLLLLCIVCFYFYFYFLRWGGEIYKRVQN